MAYTVFASPLHLTPQQLEMPVQQDNLGHGTNSYRRLYTRPLSSWQLENPGKQELLDPTLGFIEYVQGDTPFWFDGAGFGEVTDPALIWIGDGATTDIRLPHRYVFIASMVVYYNNQLFTDWTPLGGDGVTCDAIRTLTPFTLNYHVTAKYRRRIKCVVRVEDKVTRRRMFRSQTLNSETIHSLTVSLDEVAT